MTVVRLGDKVRDRVTGLTGIVVARTEWMYGCVRCVVQPQEVKDGKPVESSHVDEPQLDILERAAVPDVPEWRESTATPPRLAAGPRSDAVRQSADPRR